MKFDLITENERLWAVRYDDCLDNVLDFILGQWNDVIWLRSFFKENIDDLASYFKITDVNQAIYDTIRTASVCSVSSWTSHQMLTSTRFSVHWRIAGHRR